MCTLLCARLIQKNRGFRGIVGLLHDLDWEEHEDPVGAPHHLCGEILEGEGASPSSFALFRRTRRASMPRCPSPSQMEKILFACDSSPA